MQQLWSYLWFRFTEITALGKSALRIFLSSEKELLRKPRLWFFGWLIDWLARFLGVLLLFSVLQNNLSLHGGCPRTSVFAAPCALSRPWGIPCEKGFGGLMLLPSLALESGKLPRWVSFLSAQLPRAFQSLKILSIHWGENVRRARGEGDKPCARNPSGWGRQVQDKTLAQERSSARSCLLCSFPQTSLIASAKYQTLHCPPALAASLRNVLAVRRSWRDQSNETQKPPHSRNPVGKEAFGWTWCYFICALAIPGSTWLKTQKRKTERTVVALRDLTVAWRAQPGTKVLEREKQAGLPWPGSWQDCQWFIKHIKFPLGFFPFSFFLLLWKWRFHV